MILPDLYPHHHRSSRKFSLKWFCISVCVLVVYVWAFNYFFVSTTGFRWRALYGDPNYPEGYEIHGIDISHHQGSIDWDRLRLAMVQRCPIRFVFIKSTEGANHLDENFYDNFYQARETGLIRGAYHFWSNKTTAEQQAHFFLSKVKLEEGDLPPVLDIEKKPDDKPVADFQNEILVWLSIVESRYHVKPIIYTYYHFKEQYLSDKRFDDYPYWIAHYYVEKMEYTGSWKFWQHTDAGKLPGIRGYVDLDVYNGSFYDLHRLTISEMTDNGQ